MGEDDDDDVDNSGKKPPLGESNITFTKLDSREHHSQCSHTFRLKFNLIQSTTKPEHFHLHLSHFSLQSLSSQLSLPHSLTQYSDTGSGWMRRNPHITRPMTQSNLSSHQPPCGQPPSDQARCSISTTDQNHHHQIVPCTNIHTECIQYWTN